MRVLFTLGVIVLSITRATSARGEIYPPACEFPTHVNLVGSTARVPDPAGRFTAVIRDMAGNPQSGVLVVLARDQAADLRLCIQQHDPEMTLFCWGPYGGERVHAYTDANGRVAMTVTGAGYGPASSHAGSCRFTADGVSLTFAFGVGTYDLDGVGGVAGNDLSMWLGEFQSDPGLQRDDFDGSGSVGGNDLSLLLGVFGAGGSTESCASVCP